MAEELAISLTMAGLPVGYELGGRYRIVRELGRGGMGVVYEATHLALERVVALKTLHPALLQEPSAVARFIREARLAASIGHPGIVHVFDLGTDRGVTYLAMERLRGEDLRAHIDRAGPLPVAQVIGLGRELAEAIAAAHARGVLHCDLTPRNVFLASDDLGHRCAKVLDFGVAKLSESLARESITQSKQTLGTLMYMAPERVGGASADTGADVYAIGAVLYEALTGSAPFSACPYHELALKIALEKPARLRSLRPDCPPRLAAAIERAMHKQPPQRWPSAQALADALAALGSETAAPVADGADRTQDAAPPVLAVERNVAARRVGAGSVLALAAGAAALAIVGSSLGKNDTNERRGAPVLAHAAAPEPQRAADGVGPRTAPETQLAATSGARAAIDAPISSPSSVRVITHPAGATVTLDGRSPCRAPCVQDAPGDVDSVLRAQLRGYRRSDRKLEPPLPSTVELWLQASPTAPQPAPPTSPQASAPLPPLLPRR